MAAGEKPRGSNPVLWLFGCLAVGIATAIGLRPPAEPSPQAKVPEKVRGEHGVKQPEDPSLDPLEVLRNYLEVEPLDGKRAACEAKKPLWQYLQLQPAQFEFLIVTVPDPVE